ncbi:MAG TPA: DUF362 domain-containing protein [Chthonomonadaceae bacterium]|nr:DUF362 domain-containing protein [Chthonomonadaceae bacterium]
MQSRERVSLVTCAPTVEDAEVVGRTEQAISQLGDFGRDLRSARRIAVKINAGIRRIRLTDGKQTELTEPAVVEGAIRALRAVTDAEILVGDAPTDGSAEALYADLGYPERLAKYPNVRLVDFNVSELVPVPMTHPGAMFRQYMLPCELAEADAFVSLAKMKAHTSMGCTLCIKNLFGWIPPAVYGSPRSYLHDRLIRLPRVLVDLAAWTRPCLNVVDGIVAANNSEWRGTPMRPGVILAGANIVATDSVGARIMGFDPCGDYPDHPFFYRRNAIQLAAKAGLGPNRADEIEVIGPAPEEVCQPFQVHRYGGDTNRDAQIRRGADCVARYRDQQDALAGRYRDRYLALFDGQILWDGQDVQTMQRLEKESGRDWQNAPQFVVRCLPSEEEIEQMDWYAMEAARLPVASAA